MPSSFRRLWTVVVVSVALSACSGGGANLTASPHQVAGATHTASATFTIRWTNPTLPASLRRRDTISPAAQSISVSVNGKPAAIVDRNGSPTQTIVLDAPVGNDAFAFNVYDQANALGHLLGSANVVQQIVDGAANQVSATITAVCAATNVSLTAPDPLSVTKLAPAGVYAVSLQSIVLLGQYNASLTVEPEDADGNVIIAPAGGVPTATITGSATIAPVDSSHLQLSPSSGPRTMTPDTLTVAAPGCPPTMIAVQHSAAIYAENTAGDVQVLDWYGDLVMTATLFPGDALIGYDTAAHKLVVHNANSDIAQYPPDLGARNLLYSVGTSDATWSSAIHGPFTAVGYLSGAYLFDTWVNGVDRQIYSELDENNTIKTVVTASTFTTSSLGAAYFNAKIENLDLFSVNTVPLATTFSPQVNALAENDHTKKLVAFNASAPYVSVFNQNLSGTPLSGNSGFTAVPALGTVDTDSDNLYAIVNGGLIEASSASGTPLSGFGMMINGTSQALVVISTNEH